MNEGSSALALVLGGDPALYAIVSLSLVVSLSATAVAAVRSAARACRAVQERLVRPEALEKGDKSPVTVADFASQAIICAELERALPRDPVVGEEDADTLRHEASLLAVVVERVSEQRGEASGLDRRWIGLERDLDVGRRVPQGLHALDHGAHSRGLHQ